LTAPFTQGGLREGAAESLPLVRGGLKQLDKLKLAFRKKTENGNDTAENIIVLLVCIRYNGIIMGTQSTAMLVTQKLGGNIMFGFQLPKVFLIGTANSAFQSEGLFS